MSRLREAKLSARSRQARRQTAARIHGKIKLVGQPHDARYLLHVFRLRHRLRQVFAERGVKAVGIALGQIDHDPLWRENGANLLQCRRRKMARPRRPCPLHAATPGIALCVHV